METTLKNLLYAGAGLAAEATEKIQTEVDKLVKKGKNADFEAKRVVEDFISKTETKTGEFEAKFNEFISKFGFAKTSEVEELRAKLEKLEAASATTKTTATKSATAKA